MMTNTLHTPLRLSSRRSDVIVNSFGVDVATTVSVDHALPIIRSANAHDDMLAALRKAEDFIAGFEDDDTQEGVLKLLQSIRAAIAKAEGRATKPTPVPRDTSSVTVVLEGGRVLAVITDDPAKVGGAFEVIDYDTDGSDPADLGKVQQKDGTISDAHVYGGYVERAQVVILEDSEDDTNG